MGKDMIKPKRKMTEEEQILRNWLDMAPARAETRRFDYWFERVKQCMYGNINHPENAKSRWSMMLTRMETDFPQYAELKGGTAHLNSVLYKSMWRHF